MKFYIASRLDNAETVKRIAAVLTAAGHVHTYDWTTHGSVQHENPIHIATIAEAELKGVTDADIVIVILPGGRGTHVELGIALAGPRSLLQDTAVIICAETDDYFQQDERTCAFYWAPGVNRVSGSIDEWLTEILRQINSRTVE